MKFVGSGLQRNVVRFILPDRGPFRRSPSGFSEGRRTYPGHDAIRKTICNPGHDGRNHGRLKDEQLFEIALAVHAVALCSCRRGCSRCSGFRRWTGYSLVSPSGCFARSKFAARPFGTGPPDPRKPLLSCLQPGGGCTCRLRTDADVTRSHADSRRRRPLGIRLRLLRASMERVTLSVWRAFL